MGDAVTDDDNTIRRLTDEERMAHFDDYPPGTPPVEHRLDARLARVERENETLRREVSSLASSRDTGRKLMWLVIPALVGALATVLVFAAEKIASSAERAGEVKSDLRSLEKQVDTKDRVIDQMQREIDQLRGVLLKLGVIDAKSLSIVRNP